MLSITSHKQMSVNRWSSAFCTFLRNEQCYHLYLNFSPCRCVSHIAASFPFCSFASPLTHHSSDFVIIGGAHNNTVITNQVRCASHVSNTDHPHGKAGTAHHTSNSTSSTNNNNSNNSSHTTTNTRTKGSTTNNSNNNNSNASSSSSSSSSTSSHTHHASSAGINASKPNLTSKHRSSHNNSVAVTTGSTSNNNNNNNNNNNSDNKNNSQKGVSSNSTVNSVNNKTNTHGLNSHTNATLLKQPHIRSTNNSINKRTRNVNIDNKKTSKIRSTRGLPQKRKPVKTRSSSVVRNKSSHPTSSSPSLSNSSNNVNTNSSSSSSSSSSLSASQTEKSTKPRRLFKKNIRSKLNLSAKRRSKWSKKIRVCVLNSSYEGTNSETAALDNYWCTPQYYVKKNKDKYTFDDVAINKIDSYKTVRELASSDKYDVFFNLCDGGRDEKRAGVDVVLALEEMNAAFTGSDARSFEPSKVTMKLLVGSSGVKVPNFVLLENDQSLAKKCRHLRFPVIVKHHSGYASVGIDKDSRCDNFDELKRKVKMFIEEYNHALVEEFIRGREGTALACADANSPFGVKVFRPLMFNFLEGPDDFAYFDKKWTIDCDNNAYALLPGNDPLLPEITNMARSAYLNIMNGVGYGRVDFRVDERSNEPYFIEINPNCGMWYSEKDGGDFADVMVQGDGHWDHEKFFTNAVQRAMKAQLARKPWYLLSHDKHGQFTTRASRSVDINRCLFGDMQYPIPVIAKALFKHGAEEPQVGCVVSRADGLHGAVAIRHSCEPNMHFVHGRTLMFASKRPINAGEELTVDYATIRDESMPHFACSCGTEHCRSVIFTIPAMPRSSEMRGLKALTREKKRQWLKEKADREAEKLLKKRTANTSSTNSNTTNKNAHSSNVNNGSTSNTNTTNSNTTSGASSSSSTSSHNHTHSTNINNSNNTKGNNNSGGGGNGSISTTVERCKLKEDNEILQRIKKLIAN